MIHSLKMCKINSHTVLQGHSLGPKYGTRVWLKKLLLQNFSFHYKNLKKNFTFPALDCNGKKGGQLWHIFSCLSCSGPAGNGSNYTVGDKSISRF
jgi:hypothetical protein